ncbi:hypothetical protein D3C83_56620 [compost metagenome]
MSPLRATTRSFGLLKRLPSKASARIVFSRVAMSTRAIARVPLSARRSPPRPTARPLDPASRMDAGIGKSRSPDGARNAVVTLPSQL